MGWVVCRRGEGKGAKREGKDKGVPWLTSMSVMVCHLSMATNHLSSPPCRRQLRSITSLLLSPSSAARTESRRGWEKVPLGKRKEVMMTWGALVYIAFFLSTGNTNLLGTGFYPLFGVGVVNATPNLQCPWPGCQRLPRSILVARAQHDNVGTGEVIIAV